MAEEKSEDIFREAKDAARMGEQKSQLRELAVELNKAAPEGEIITREQIEAAEKNMERIAKMVRSPEGKCRVIGVDKFDGEDWVVGEYDTPEKALRIARKKTNKAKALATSHSVATVYYAYDPEGNYLGGDAWVNE